MQVFVHLRLGPGILHLYARTTLLHRFAFSASSLRSSLHSRRPSHGKQGVALLNTEEGRVNDAQWIRLRFQLHGQHVLVIYTLLPVCIMTSTLVTVYFRIMHHFQVRISTYVFLLCGILLGATFFMPLG